MHALNVNVNTNPHAVAHTDAQPDSNIAVLGIRSSGQQIPGVCVVLMYSDAESDSVTHAVTHADANLDPLTRTEFRLPCSGSLHLLLTPAGHSPLLSIALRPRLSRDSQSGRL